MPSVGSAILQGTPDSEMTPEAMLKIGQTIGMQYKHVTVGRNLRPSSVMMLNSLIAGITSTGADVIDAGIIPVPALPFVAGDSECAVMIGNPDDKDRISGATLLNTDGRIFNDPQIFAFTNRLNSEKTLCNYIHVGNIKKYTGANDSYIREVVKFVGNSDCQVVLDCASDSAAIVMPSILANMGADAITINCHPDGRTAGRESRPEEINLKSVTKVVKANFGSIGLATNGDGTCIAAIDESGRYINGEKIFELLVKYLQPKSVAVPVNVSLGIKDLSKANIVMTGINPNSIGETVKTNDLELGGCINGSFIFGEMSYAMDGIAAGAILTKIATEGSLQDFVDELPQYYHETDSIIFTADRETVAKKISSKVSDIEYEMLYIVDGWRVEMDGGWFLIRFSDHKDTIDIIAEGTDRIFAVSLMEVAKEIVTESIKSSNI